MTVSVTPGSATTASNCLIWVAMTSVLAREIDPLKLTADGSEGGLARVTRKE